MRKGLLRYSRDFMGFCLLSLLVLFCLTHAPASQAACTSTTVESLPNHFHTVADCSDQVSARDACHLFAATYGYTSDWCHLGGAGSDGRAGYGAGWLHHAGNNSGAPYYLGNFLYCEVSDSPQAKYVGDTFYIQRYHTNNGSACPMPPPELMLSQKSGASPGEGPDKCYANPVDCSSGQKIQREIDYANAEFEMARSFASRSLGAPASDPEGWTAPRARLTIISMLGYDVAVFSMGNWRRVFYRTSGVTAWSSNRTDDGTLTVVSGINVFKTPQGRNYEFDSLGRLSARVEADGHRLNLSYSSNAYGGSTETYTSTLSGRSYQLVTNAAGQLVEFVDPVGAKTLYGWDSWGRMVSVTRPDDTPLNGSDNPLRQYLYEDSSFPQSLTGIIDENGDRYATYSYDAQGRAILSEHAGGAGRFTFSYPSSTSTLVREYFDATRYTERQFALAIPAPERGKRITSVTYSNCPDCNLTSNVETYVYNVVSGWMTSKVDKRGITTGYNHHPTYGVESDRTEAQGTSLSRVISTGWGTPLEISQIVQPGRTHYFYRNSLGKILEYDDYTSEGMRITGFGYHAGNKRLSAVNGPRTDVSDVTTFAYDSQANLSQITRPLSLVTQITHYDGHGNPLRILDPNGVETLLTYDARQNLLTRSIAGETTEFEYDSLGQLTKVTAPDGAFLTYTYDAAHRLTGIADQDGNRVEYNLDWAGNRLSEKVYDASNVLRRSESRSYDGLSRVKEWQGGDGQVITYTYDGNNNLISQTQDSRTTTYEYDALNRLVKVTDPTVAITQYAYNARDELISVTDPRSLATHYVRNTFGDTTQLQSPDTGNSPATYDTASNLKTRTDAKGQVVTYSYDALNRVTQAVYTGGPTVTYSYDAGPYGKGRLTGISGPGASLAWTYTAHGRVATQTQVVGARTLVTSYSYDSAGRLATQTLPSGKVVGYQWTLNRLTGVTLDGNPVASNLAHEPFGGVSQWDFANGQPVQKSFDLSGRMTAHSLGTLGYDSADRITGLSHGGLSQLTGTKTYGYDALDRLTSYLGASFGIGYSYDANGNRTQQSGSGGTLDYTISSTSNRLDSLTDGTTTQSFSYDANGSLTADGLHTYGYDKTGRLASLDGSTAYAYNGLGQRVGKTASGTGTVYAYDEAGHLLGEYDAATGNPIQETIWMGDTPIAVVKGSGTYYVHADHLNTPRQINNQAGDPVWVWDTITFGSSSPDEDPLSTGTPFTYNLRHPGQYYDAESGLFQNWHRTYSAALGRYTQVDPLGLADGVNPYLYAAGNPLSYMDPYGLYCLTPDQINYLSSAIGGGLGGTVGGAIAGAKLGGVYGAIAMGLAGGLRGAGVGQITQIAVDKGGPVTAAAANGIVSFGNPLAPIIGLTEGLVQAGGATLFPDVANTVSGVAGGAVGGGAVGAIVGGPTADIANALLQKFNDCDCQ